MCCQGWARRFACSRAFPCAWSRTAPFCCNFKNQRMFGVFDHDLKTTKQEQQPKSFWDDSIFGYVGFQDAFKHLLKLRRSVPSPWSLSHSCHSSSNHSKSKVSCCIVGACWKSRRSEPFFIIPWNISAVFDH